MASSGERGGEDEEHPIAESLEIWSWYAYDVGSSAISSVVIAGFLPLLLQNAALAQAGFPKVCPNIVRNDTLVEEVFPKEDTMYRVVLDEDRADACKGEWCPGYPQTSLTCLEENGKTRFPLLVKFGVIDVEPTAYASGALSASVLAQVFVFLSFTAIADYGGLRKKLLTAITIIGGIGCIALLGVTPDTWWMGGILTVLINVMLGASYIFINSYLYELSAKSRPVVEAVEGGELEEGSKEYEEKVQDVMDRISTKGFALGYWGSVVILIISLVIAIFLDPILAYPLICAMCGVWWMGWAVLTIVNVKARPGPPLPEKENYFTLSWRNLSRTCGNAWKLQQLFMLLVAWFISSDAVFLIASVGALAANTEIHFITLPKSIGIALLFVIAPTAAGAGNFLYDAIAARWSIKGKKIVMATIVGNVLLSIWGIIGIWNKTIGFRVDTELYIAVTFYGFHLGAFQSFARSLYASMVPFGMSAEFFSFWEITDRGSSWIGPMLVSILLQSGANIRQAFWYVFCCLIISFVMLWYLNEDQGVADAKSFTKKIHLAGETPIPTPKPTPKQPEEA